MQSSWVDVIEFLNAAVSELHGHEAIDLPRT